MLHIVSGAQLILKASRGKQVSIEDLLPLTLLGELADDVLGWSCAEDTADFDGDGIGEGVVGARDLYRRCARGPSGIGEGRWELDRDGLSDLAVGTPGWQEGGFMRYRYGSCPALIYTDTSVR